MKDYFVLTIRNESAIEGGPRHGSKYSLSNACASCGTGAELLEPHILKRVPKRRGIFLTDAFEVIASDDIVEIFKENDISCFGEVRQYKTDIILPFKFIKGQKVLPPFHKSSKGFERENPCDSCGRDGYFNVPKQPLSLKYSDAAEFEGLHILSTFERFGRSFLNEPFYQSWFASHRYVISEEVKNLLDDLKLKYLEFNIVEFT